MSKEKLLGQVFTPVEVATMMLDEVGYTGDKVLTSTIMEPSFGQGVFLVEAARRILNASVVKGLTPHETRSILENNLYGVEIDSALHRHTLRLLNALVSAHGLTEVNWQFMVGDTLDFVDEFQGKFDFVVGNPPYVRIHNLGPEMRSKVKNYRFTSGTTDLYIAFFELGLSFLNDTGQLIYITPNSWLRNTSQGKLRRYFHEERLLRKVINFRSSAIFDDAATYAAITHLAKGNEDADFTYASYTGNSEDFSCVIEVHKHWKSSADAVAPWSFGDAVHNKRLTDIMNRSKRMSDKFTAQHGVGTYRDKVYICGKPQASDTPGLTVFNGHEVEDAILRPVVKGSTYQGQPVTGLILFPYYWDEDKGTHVAIDEDDMQAKFPLAYAYLTHHKDELDARDMDKGAKTWYQFARSQGLLTIGKPKLVVGHVIAGDKQTLSVHPLPAETVVYSGLYVTSKNGATLEEAAKVLESEEFCWYAKVSGKDMSGGYKFINAKIVNGFGIPE